jgi:hypothetical protein
MHGSLFDGLHDCHVTFSVKATICQLMFIRWKISAMYQRSLFGGSTLGRCCFGQQADVGLMSLHWANVGLTLVQWRNSVFQPTSSQHLTVGWLKVCLEDRIPSIATMSDQHRHKVGTSGRHRPTGQNDVGSAYRDNVISVLSCCLGCVITVVEHSILNEFEVSQLVFFILGWMECFSHFQKLNLFTSFLSVCLEVSKSPYQSFPGLYFL